MPSILPSTFTVCACNRYCCVAHGTFLALAERSTPRLQRGRSRHKMSTKRSFGQLDLVVTKRKKQRGAAAAIRTFKYAPRRAISGQVYKFRRSASALFPIGPAGWDNAGADLTFTTALGSASINISGTLARSVAIPNVSEFTNLYDQFRITKIRMRWWLSRNLSNTVAASKPLLHIVNDYNSTGSFSLVDVQQHQDMRSYQFKEGSPIVWDLYPHMRIDVLQDSGVLSSSAYNIKSDWVDTSSPNTQFLGTQVFLNMMGDSSTFAVPYPGYIFMEMEYYFEFKNVK